MSETGKQLICDGAVVANDWTIIAVDADANAALPAHAVLPLAQWLAKVSRCDTVPAAQAALPAVWLAPEDDPAALADALNGDLSRLPLIAIDFPRFVEGRGFSSAYLLRQRLGYAGELRAFGNIGRDHVWQLARVGLNSFDLRAGTDLVDALQALSDFPERYQASVDEALPLFRRRQTTGAVNA